MTLNNRMFDFILFIIHLCVAYQESEEIYTKRDFKAAVIEYQPVPFNPQITAHDYLMQNVAKLKEYTTQNPHLDVLVFPEYGLTSTEVLNFNIDLYAQDLPETLDADPCSGNSSFWSILEHISCIVKTGKLYVIINLITRHFRDYDGCDKDVCYFNTALVFDRQGYIIAKYHKIHVYEAPILDVPRVEKPVVFHTDFGYTFGLMICFDINYEVPAQDLIDAKVDALVFQAAWTDELPFLTALQYHFGWALANNVTLISAGYHDPKTGSMGSGIFQGGQVLNLTYASNSGSKIVTAQVGAKV